jgi:hypothetical protein
MWILLEAAMQELYLTTHRNEMPILPLPCILKAKPVYDQRTDQSEIPVQVFPQMRQNFDISKILQSSRNVQNLKRRMLKWWDLNPIIEIEIWKLINVTLNIETQAGYWRKRKECEGILNPSQSGWIRSKRQIQSQSKGTEEIIWRAENLK